MFELNLIKNTREFLLSVARKLMVEIQRPDNLQNVLLVVAAFISGLVAVAYAKLFKFSEVLLVSLIGEKRALIFIITPAFFLLAWWIVFRFCREAAGSGIPQVLLSNEINDDGPDRIYIRRFLSLRVILIKTISSLLCVIGGGAIGREGPTIQISASIFYLFGERVKRILPSSKSHFWIITGASAGLAAAFNTPLGGIIYAIEELGHSHFGKIRTILLAAIIISGFVSLGLSGNYLYLGYPKIAIEGISIVPMAILVGILSGMAGSLFSIVLFTLSRMRKRIKSPVRLGGIAVLCGLAMAMMIYFSDDAAGSGVNLLNEFLFHKKSSDLLLVLSRFFGTIITYLAGSAGGIFSPSLSIGGSLGEFIATQLGSPDKNILALFGMIGFLTGVTKTPFTSFILVVEMTNLHSAIFPMMVTALVAIISSNLIDKHSFYERVKDTYREEIETEKFDSLQNVG